MVDLVLASGSPRRASLLEQLKLRFRVIVPNIDERLQAGEQHREYVQRMSRQKNARAREMLDDREPVVLCADTVVVRDGKILGKPRDERDCVDTLMSLSGLRHSVVTAVTISRDGDESTFAVETIVKFRQLTIQECRNYWATGEPLDKAGAYGIQGVGAIFVEAINGSYSNVVGLPLSETAEKLREFGIDCLGIAAGRPD